MELSDIDLHYYWEDNIPNINVLLHFYLTNEKVNLTEKELQDIRENFQNKNIKIAVAAIDNVVVGLAITNLENQIDKFSIINAFKNKDKETEFKNWIQK